MQAQTQDRSTRAQHGHFATQVSSALKRHGVSIVELGKKLGISYEHARKITGGIALPSRLLVEKTAQVLGIPAEQLEHAVERDRLSKNYSAKFVAEVTGLSKRLALFEPLIESLSEEQVPAAYAMLEGLAKAAQALKQKLPNEHTGRKFRVE
jgi:transcriptional regulator with XRE-family HTH domain